MLEGGLSQILEKVHRQKRYDFRQYKESTLRRRVQRRLRATRALSYEQYTGVLDAEPGEYAKLIDDLTIQVTELFRNPQAWQILKHEVLSNIVRQKLEEVEQKKNTRPTLRIWCAGCASGEEAYSVAILLDQLLREEKHGFESNIRGTDIDRQSLLKAKRAEYQPDLLKSTPQDILNKYFDSNGTYRVASSIRQGLRFEPHDLVLDEPLKQMDLIICRNVAIYFTRPLQAKVFMDFCNSLNEGGFLFLGKAETLIGPAKERFTTIDKRWRIYQKNVLTSNYS